MISLFTRRLGLVALESRHAKSKSCKCSVVITVVCITFQNGWSPLLVACEQGHLEILKILLKNHARVDVFDEVCLFYFQSCGFLILELLIVQ